MLKLLERAAKIAAKKGDAGRSFRLGAVAVRRDGAIVSASNGSSYVPYVLAHAECRALAKCDHGATMYVARVSRRDGKLVMSRPCSGCQILLKARKINRCYYTINDNSYGVMIFNNNGFTEKIYSV